MKNDEQLRKRNRREKHDLKQLKTIISQHAVIPKILSSLKQFSIPLYLAAGVIRNTVWAHLHDIEYDLNRTEIDVIFYDSHDDGSFYQDIENVLSKIFPHIKWDVTNQALVHQWYKTDRGESIAPLFSIELALSLWLETATAVAIRLTENNKLECIAPFGLSDLFELKLRWNSKLVSYEVFQHRISSKKFLEKWYLLKLIKDT